jgi:polar amino acid transport system ATP-binding protein
LVDVMKSFDEAASQTPAISFDNVTKKFGAHVVLNELCLEVSKGETVVLIGPSGSGKTTVLRLVMMLEDVSSGDIKLFGESMSLNADGKPLTHRERAGLRRRCGMVFQQYNLFPHMSVLKNLMLAQRTVLKMSVEDSERRALDYLARVGLEDRAGAYPGQLSGGQQQRVAIARALTLRPEVLLLDEITSALDPELVGEVLEVVQKVALETNITMLIVTHEMRFARQVADRVAMFDGGRIVETAHPDVMFSEPESERTRAFLHSVLDH